MPAKLTVISGPDRGRAFDVLDDQKLTIGRGETTNTKLKDPTVSRTHCQITCEAGRFPVEPLEARRIRRARRGRKGSVRSRRRTEVRRSKPRLNTS